jgi:hypothetical protein
MIIAFEPEPSPLMRAFEGAQPEPVGRIIRPWRLPPGVRRLAPSPLQRFVTQRCQDVGIGLTGFPLVELAARAWAGSRTDRTLHSRFLFRRLLGQWAARQPGVPNADAIIAPSCAARYLFSAAPTARKILLLDMPGLRCLHDDLDLAATQHVNCAYLNRYRAPDWTVVDQEVEWQLADEIHVRGRFAHQLLLNQGVPAEKILLFEPAPPPPALREEARPDTDLHVLLAGLASARHGTNELLKVLDSRPWLQVYARAGEGCEPAEFVQHPRVHSATAGSLLQADAVLVPSFCETYLPELNLAAASGVPIIASLRGAGAVPREQLFAELPPRIEPALGKALDALYVRVNEERPRAQRPAGLDH